jgi:hypothetical protein
MGSELSRPDAMLCLLATVRGKMNLKHAKIASVSQHAAANAERPRGFSSFSLTSIVAQQVSLYSRNGSPSGNGVGVPKGRLLGVLCRNCFMRVPNLHNHCCPKGHQ